MRFKARIVDAGLLLSALLSSVPCTSYTGLATAMTKSNRSCMMKVTPTLYYLIQSSNSALDMQIWAQAKLVRR